MLRKFLTEAEKAELDEECERYMEWRLTESQSLSLSPEGSVDGANDHRNRNKNTSPLRRTSTDSSGGRRARPRASSRDAEDVADIRKRSIDTVKSNETGQWKIKPMGKWLTPNVEPNDPGNEREKNNRGDSVQGSIRPPVTFLVEGSPLEAPDPEMASIRAAEQASKPSVRAPKTLSVDEIFARGSDSKKS